MSENQFVFGQKVHELDNPALAMTVVQFTYFSPDYCEVSCTYWLDGKSEAPMSVTMRIIGDIYSR